MKADSRSDADHHPALAATATRADAAAAEPCCSLALDAADEARLVALFKALGHPLRFEILKFLVTHPGCITGDLVEHLPIAQSTVSQHLKVLKDAGWIQGVVHGPAVCYCLDPERVAWFRRTVHEIF